MSRKPEIDEDNPPWTRERIANSIPFSALPEDLQRILTKKRGPQTDPKKVPISIRLSPDVAQGLRATGKGWQARANEALRSWLLSTHGIRQDERG